MLLTKNIFNQDNNNFYNDPFEHPKTHSQIYLHTSCDQLNLCLMFVKRFPLILIHISPLDLNLAGIIHFQPGLLKTNRSNLQQFLK